MSEFRGFDHQSVALLSGLPGLDEASYMDLKGRLTNELRKPAGLLIAAVAAELDAGLAVDKRTAVSTLHRDLRFASPGTPRYKDHLLLTCYQGSERKRAPTLWIRIDASSVGFASGVALDGQARAAFREAVASDDGQRLQAALEALRKRPRPRDLDVAGASLKRVPKPWGEDHPRAELLRVTGAFQARFREPLPTSVSTGAFVSHCAQALSDLMPVHRWLTQVLAP